MLKGQIFATFKSWATFTHTQIATRHRVRIITAKFMFKELSRAFTTWNRAIDLSNRNIFNEVKSTADQALERLNEVHRSNKKRMMARVKNIIVTHFNQTMFLHFSIWATASLEFTKHENLVKKYASKLWRGVLVRVFVAWGEFAKDAIRHR